MWIIALIFMALASFIAIANIYGCMLAGQNRRKNINKGYSCVLALSLICCIIAYFLGKGIFGFLAFIPALIDPGTWLILCIPWVIWTQFLKSK